MIWLEWVSEVDLFLADENFWQRGAGSHFVILEPKFQHLFDDKEEQEQDGIDLPLKWNHQTPEFPLF